MNIGGIIFWIIVFNFVFSKIGRAAGKEVNVLNYKQYDREEQKIARKYDPNGYLWAVVTVLKDSSEIFEKYNNEVNALKRKYGLPEYQYSVADEAERRFTNGK